MNRRNAIAWNSRNSFPTGSDWTVVVFFYYLFIFLTCQLKRRKVLHRSTQQVFFFPFTDVDPIGEYQGGSKEVSQDAIQQCWQNTAAFFLCSTHSLFLFLNSVTKPVTPSTPERSRSNSANLIRRSRGCKLISSFCRLRYHQRWTIWRLEALLIYTLS